ncbi:MAG: OmpA family protein [Bacteroidota bacterium]
MVVKKSMFITLLLFYFGIQAQDLTVSKLNPAEKKVENSTLDSVQSVALTVPLAPLTDTVSASGKSKVDRLLKTANDYFKKMWYAEAAQLYDKALKNNPSKHTVTLIQNAGDAHYFSSNMKKAEYWYSLLFERYQEQTSKADLLKYSHILKGMGRYRKAKRLVRLLESYSNEAPTDPSLNNTLKGETAATKDSIFIKNLGFNSEYSEFSPLLLADNTLIFASSKDSLFFNTRRYKWNNQPYLDLYKGSWDEASDVLHNVTKFSKKINTKYHEAAASFSPDNETMYFTRNNYGKRLKRGKKGINHLKIYKSRKIDQDWSKAVELPFNSEDYSCGHPAVSPDGKKLYFVSDMPGGFGKTDIYVVNILEDGSFSEPKNLGRSLNTSEKEMFPFVTENSIYFSSDRPFGFGGLDIYNATYSDHVFNVATNMGKPINSNRDDFSLTVNETTDTGYFASNRTGGKGDDDIYSFKRLRIEKPKANTSTITGVITDILSGRVLPNATVALFDENAQSLLQVTSGDDGQFIFEDLPKNTKYTIKANVAEYLESEQLVAIESVNPDPLEIRMNPVDDLIVLEEGVKKLKTDVIYFDFDKYTITDAAAAELNKLVAVWEKYPNMVIRIESHTDSRGPKAYNQILSDKRAKASRDYLISKGIPSDRIANATGYGEEQLLNNCANGVRCTKAQHEQNRRSEFVIVEM